jgi:hypothetical protein
MGEIFASYSSDKGLISRICKGLKKLSTKITNSLINKWENKLNRQVSKEKAQMARKYKKKHSASLATKEILIKMTLRFHLIPVRMSALKKTNNNKCW